MNRLDYIIGLLVALLFHIGLFTIASGLWKDDTTGAKPIFQFGESALAMTFIAPASAGATIAQPQKATPVAAPVYTEPEEEAEEEESPAQVAVPDFPSQPPESQSSPEQPEESDEDPSDFTQNESANNTPSDKTLAQPEDGAAPQSDADELAKGIKGLPRMSSGVRPIYPIGARHRGEQGNVTLRLRVGADGKILDAVVAQSSGYPELDQSAIKAIRRARFMPGRKNGVPVESESSLTFSFQLENQ